MVLAAVATLLEHVIIDPECHVPPKTDLDLAHVDVLNLANNALRVRVDLTISNRLLVLNLLNFAVSYQKVAASLNNDIPSKFPLLVRQQVALVRVYVKYSATCIIHVIKISLLFGTPQYLPRNNHFARLKVLMGVLDLKLVEEIALSLKGSFARQYPLRDHRELRAVLLEDKVCINLNFLLEISWKVCRSHLRAELFW